MKIRFVIIVTALLFLGIGCGTPEEKVPDISRTQEHGRTVLPVGVMDVQSTDCPNDLSGSCLQARVACPDTDTAGATIRITGPGTAGTVLLSTGGEGTGLYDMEGRNDIAGQSVRWMMEELKRDGYRLVEVAWRPSVWLGPAWARTNSCRYATFARWTHENLHEGGMFAAQGNSGGSAQIAFAVAYYGIDDILDVVNLGGGPPPCPRADEDGVNPDEQYLCTGGVGVWDESREPFLSGDAWFAYPTMMTNLFLGENEPTEEIIATARTYHFLITSPKSMTVVPDTGHGVHKTMEGAAALVDAIRDTAARL